MLKKGEGERGVKNQTTKTKGQGKLRSPWLRFSLRFCNFSAYWN